MREALSKLVFTSSVSSAPLSVSTVAVLIVGSSVRRKDHSRLLSFEFFAQRVAAKLPTRSFPSAFSSSESFPFTFALSYATRGPCAALAVVILFSSCIPDLEDNNNSPRTFSTFQPFNLPTLLQLLLLLPSYIHSDLTTLPQIQCLVD
jgi:hypothetical protein